MPSLRASRYQVVPVIHAQALLEILGRGLGIQARVAKRRHLFMLGRTRVHLDHVEELGSFVELEVVLREGEAVEAGNREASAILHQLGLSGLPPIAGSYADLVSMKSNQGGLRKAEGNPR